MEALYSYSGAYPAPLPHRIILPSGLSRTDPTTFTADELTACGFKGPVTVPSFDKSLETLSWDGSVLKVVPLTADQLNKIN